MPSVDLADVPGDRGLQEASMSEELERFYRERRKEDACMPSTLVKPFPYLEPDYG